MQSLFKISDKENQVFEVNILTVFFDQFENVFLHTVPALLVRGT